MHLIETYEKIILKDTCRLGEITTVVACCMSGKISNEIGYVIQKQNVLIYLGNLKRISTETASLWFPILTNM